MRPDSIKFLSAGKFSTASHTWIHPKITSAFDELIYVTKGTLSICEDYSEYSLTENSAIWLRHGHLHYGCSSTDKPLSFIRIIFSAGPEDNSDSNGSIHLRKITRTKNHEKFLSLCRILIESADEPEYPPYFKDHITGLLLTELAVQGTEYDGTLSVQQQISRWIKNDAPSGIKVSDVAKHFGYSEDHITRIFKDYYSKGIKNYIDGVRISRIRSDILGSGKTLAEIAEANGFISMDAFHKFFKAKTGMTSTLFLALYKDK